MQRIKIKPKLTFNDITMIVDGRYLCYRTKYSRQGNLSYGGMNTGMFYGFFNTIQSLANKFNVTNTVIMWDITKVGVRKREFDGYKDRELPEMTPEEKEEKRKFEDAYNYLMSLCHLIGFATYVLPDYEADDLIALWCNTYWKGSNIIITRDEDMYQLLDKNTTIYDPDSKKMKDETWFEKTYGITPDMWADYKSIAGCKSDTVPGIPGMGEKRTLNYLSGKEPKWNDLIEQHQALQMLCYNLVVLPHPSLENYWLPYKETKLDLDAFKEFCVEMGMVSFVEKEHNFYIFLNR